MKAKELAEILLTKPDSNVCIKGGMLLTLMEILIIVQKILNQSVWRMESFCYLKSN